MGLMWKEKSALYNMAMMEWLPIATCLSLTLSSPSAYGIAYGLNTGKRNDLFEHVAYRVTCTGYVLCIYKLKNNKLLKNLPVLLRMKLRHLTRVLG